jgi:hypothetical protein
MDRYSGSQRTTMTANHDLVIAVLDFGCAAERFQHPHGSVYALLQVGPFSFRRPTRDRTSHFAKDLFDFRRLQTILQNGD